MDELLKKYGFKEPPTGFFPYTWEKGRLHISANGRGGYWVTKTGTIDVEDEADLIALLKLTKHVKK